MKDVLYGSAGELLGVVVYGVVAVVLTLLGAVAEVAASQDLLTGQLTIGLWEAGLGLLLFYAGINVVTDFVLPELRASEGDGDAA